MVYKRCERGVCSRASTSLDPICTEHNAAHSEAGLTSILLLYWSSPYFSIHKNSFTTFSTNLFVYRFFHFFFFRSSDSPASLSILRARSAGDRTEAHSSRRDLARADARRFVPAMFYSSQRINSWNRVWIGIGARRDKRTSETRGFLVVKRKDDPRVHEREAPEPGGCVCTCPASLMEQLQFFSPAAAYTAVPSYTYSSFPLCCNPSLVMRYSPRFRVCTTADGEASMGFFFKFSSTRDLFLQNKEE